MASHKKKETTGISLLSMYNDEDEDMEELEIKEEHEEIEPIEEYVRDESNRMEVDDELENEEDTNVDAPSQIQYDSSTSQQQVNFNSSLDENSERRRSSKGRLAIVDYGHDEVAMSPEAEDGEIIASSAVPLVMDELHSAANGDIKENAALGTTQVLSTLTSTLQLSGQLMISQADNLDYAVSELQVASIDENVMNAEESEDADPLSKFLPPPPAEKCSQDLQERINKFLALKRTGKSYNAEVRNKKAYRNPDFLAHAVKYQEIDQLGSCFNKDVFNPCGYDKSDYFDEIEADMKRELERREQEKKKSQKVEFTAGGIQPGIVTPAPKISIPVQVPTLAASSMQSIPSTADVSRDGRQNKKSKWDKVDGDRRTLPTGGQDSIPNVGHAALLSAANAGAGYTAFAKQRRREAEEKRSSERRRT